MDDASGHGVSICDRPVASWLEAEDNYVRIWADRLYSHKDTLTCLAAKLDPESFLRVHRSHARSMLPIMTAPWQVNV